MHVVFCDVGQGDAVYIKLPDGKDILIDGGPNTDVLNCLGDHMAFWDRTIEVVVLTHPQYDHFRGLIDVVSRYTVELLIASPADNRAESYQTFKKIVQENGVTVWNGFQGDSLLLNNNKNNSITLSILWPDREWIAGTIDTGRDNKQLLNENVLGLTTNHSDLKSLKQLILLA